LIEPIQQKSRTKRVLFQPHTHQAFQRGINALVNAIGPTLGPLPGIVAIEKSPSNKPPELLDNGGVIARRIIQLEDRDADMGAMFVRQMLWNLYEKVGDGTATAAILFQSIYNHALRYLTSGGNPMPLRRHLENGLRLILEHLDEQTTRIDTTKQLHQIARSTCTDPEMADMLQEIMDIVGPYGLVETRSGQSREMGREYIEGTYWESGIISQQMLAGWPNSKVELPEAAILITDLAIDEPQELLPALNVAVKAGFKNLMIVAAKLSDKVVGLLLTANKNVQKLQLVGVKTPGASIDKVIAAMQDLATLTGGRPFSKEAGETLKNVKAEDFGHAQKAWATKTHFGILRGQGDPIQLRTHVNQLKRAYHATDDAEQAKLILDRIGRLMGGSATLYVGGATKSEVETRKELAERSVKALRGAINDGVVPGGGIVWLSCQSKLKEKISQSDGEDERVAYQILCHAMEAPLRTMLMNANLDSGGILARIRRAGPGSGYDILRGEIISMQEDGIQDVATVLKAAIHSAVSSAALALSVDVFIHHKKPPEGKLTP
jgi:chaperonin GroEL